MQRNAMKVWSGESNDFLALLKADPDVRKALSDVELEDISISAIISNRSTPSSSGCSAAPERLARRRQRQSSSSPQS